MVNGKKDKDGLFRRGGVYYCWIRGKRYSTKCRTRRGALAVREKLERAIVDPVYRASYTATVGELCRVTLDEVARRGRSDATLEYYRSKLGHLVRIFEPSLAIAMLDASGVDDYIDMRRAEGASQHTVSKELGALRHVLRVAKRRGSFGADIDSLFPVGFGTEYEPRRRSLGVDEIPRLLAELPERWRGWTAFAIATGARKGEVERAKLEDVTGLVVQLRGTKTALADDAVAVPEMFRELLMLALELADPAGPMFGEWKNATRDLADACTRAGIEKVTPNDLRRTFATLLRAGGASVDLVARQLRHADSRMAERVYGRLTAQQTGKLLGSSTVQIQLTEPVAMFPCSVYPSEMTGVSDGN